MKKYRNVEDYLNTTNIPFKLSADKTEVMVQCLFCDDEKQHLYINNEKGCWKCFHCEAKGSWFNLLDRIGESERILLESFADTQETAELAPKELELKITSDDVETYQLQVPDRIYNYLTGQERGLTVETLEEFKVGWDGRSIVFPVYDKAGNLINLRHRRDPVRSDGSKLWNEPGGRAVLFNIKAISEDRECVVLTEGEFDAMVACQNGFPAVSGTAGAGTFKPEWVSEFEKVKRVYIVYDSDEPGKQGALTAARYLGGKAYIVELPASNEGKVDVTDFFCKLKKTGEDFQKLLDSARPYVKDTNTRIIQGFEVDFSDLTKIKIKSDCFTYLLKPVNGKIDLSLYLSTKLVNRDVLSLQSAKARITFVNSVSDLDHEKRQLLGNELIQITELLEQINKEIILDKSKPENKELSQQEIEQAKELLKSPDLINKILKIIKELGVAGEEKTALIHYLVLSSGKTDDPLSVVVKGESSVGKSFVVQKVLKMFPKDCYIDITDATAQSFYYAEEDHFAHKIIIIFEKHGGEKADYSIRTFQSEKKLKIQVTVKDPETGQFITKEREVNGPVGFITTTTDANIHQENETRNISVYPDETSDQTAKTFEMTDAKYRGVKPVSENYLVDWINLQRVLTPYPVLIPFVNEVRESFPKKPLRVRRDYGKLLAIISIIALLHQEQRQKIELDGVTFIKASLVDFYIAKVLLEETLQKTIYSLSPKSESLIAAAKSIPRAYSDGFSIRQLAEEIGWDYDTAHKWFQTAFKLGYFKVVVEHSGKNAALYNVVNKELPSNKILPSVKELCDKNPEWLGDDKLYNPITGETPDINQLEQGSTDVPMQKAEVLNDPDDPVTLFDTTNMYYTRPEDIGTSEQSTKLRGTP